MTQQLSLLDPPIASNSDPATSHKAASEITHAGVRSDMARAALRLIVMTPGDTANELETRYGYKDGQIRKRLTDLERAGLVKCGPVRKSRVTGKSNHTWTATEAGRAVIYD